MNKEETIKLFKQDTDPCYSTKSEKGIIRLYHQDEDEVVSNDKLTFYCENRNAAKATGGEDSYPIAEDYFLLEADGVGNSSCHHEILEEKGMDAAKIVSKVYNLDADSVGRSQKIYRYAMEKSFVPSPPNLFYFSQFAGDRVPYSEDSLGKRTSAFLGSRLVSVGVYQNFGDFAVKNSVTDWYDKPPVGNDYSEKYPNTCWGEILTQEIQRYVDNVLRDSLVDGADPLFSYTGADINSVRRNRYFLATTLSCAFFAVNAEKESYVNALVVWIGDARCYKVDKADGVKCLTKDDSLPNSKSMSGFISFGQHPLVSGYFKDNVFNSRVVKVQKPCAFFVCSDGVYDTCPTIKSSSNATEPQNDNEFERKVLNVLKTANSMDDVYYGLAYSLYFGTDYWKDIPSQYAITNIKENIKADDSGTLALKAFWTDDCKFFSDMFSSGKPTSLERLSGLIEKSVIHYEEYSGNMPTEGGIKENEFSDYAVAAFPKSKDIIALLYKLAEKAFKSGEHSAIFGLDESKIKYIYNLLRRETVDTREGKRPVDRFINNNFVELLSKAVSEYHQANEIGIEGKVHEYFEECANRNKVSPDFIFVNQEDLDEFAKCIDSINEDEAMCEKYNASFYTKQDVATAAADKFIVSAHLFELANKTSFPFYNGKNKYYVDKKGEAFGELRNIELIGKLEKLNSKDDNYEQDRRKLRDEYIGK